MWRASMVGVLAAVLVCGMPPVATAEPVHEGDVPGMHYGVEALTACPEANATHYVYGRGSNGALMVCHINSYGRPIWDTTGGRDVRGVQQPGTSCGGAGSLAQAPNGQPLFCDEYLWRPGP